MTDLAVELRNVTKVFVDRSSLGRDLTAVEQINLSVAAGEFFTLLGPSGCGKTTTLRMIAGFEAATRGEILIQGRAMTRVPPNRRPVNTVFQNYALFPHLTVAENVAFGLVVKRVPRAERKRRAEEALELVRLSGMGRRRPSQLSGGQQQRVALARALINQPAVLLLDEPLGALDLKLRKEMQFELKRLQRQVGITFIYVTHDQEEALIMSDRIAVMERGRVLQVGDPMAVYEWPSARFVADFVGETNFLSVVFVSFLNDLAVVDLCGVNAYAQIRGEPLTSGQPTTVTIRPEKVVLTKLNQDGHFKLAGTLEDIVYLGTDTRYVVRLTSGETLVARIQNTSERGLGGDYDIGERVNVSWSPKDARVLTS